MLPWTCRIINDARAEAANIMGAKGKRIVATGGSHGIGVSAERAFVEAGAAAYSLDVN